MMQMVRAVKRALRKNPLVDTLVHLGDNSRVCVYTEPLWTVPYNLYLPFVSVYMSTLGLTDAMIGMVGTVCMVSQVAFALLSGALTDKLGRRRCTFLGDVLSWSIPTLLWALARNAWWFMVAAALNGVMRMSMNSWELLLMEDEDERVVVRIFALINIAFNLSAFIVLLSYPLVLRFGLIPAMRGMYVFAFLSMTAKFVIMFVWGRETRNGMRRMEETRGLSVWVMLKESKDILTRMLHTPKIMWTIGLLACFTGCRTLVSTFWPLLVIERMHVSEENIAFFAAAKAAISLVCFFLFSRRFSIERFHQPLTISFLVQAVSMLLLIFAPPGALWLLWVTLVLDAMSLSFLTPLTETLQLLSMDPHKRAQMLALFFAGMLLVTSPLSAIGGLLSGVNRSLPFVLTVLLSLLAIRIARKIKHD